MSTAGNGAPRSGAAEDAPRPSTEPRVMDGLSSSKVTVEYHDPSGLFPLVQEQLASRLPLRNLHWKSPNRPLRSIDSLHVDLVPSKDSVHISGVTSPGLAPPEERIINSTSAEILRPPTRETKERRHQIPGLRQTPYLKLYLLRCDDSDSYKSNARKQLREWVKTHTPPSQSSSSSTQDNHDAFEWMIIHVVLPDTQAAAQPRGSSASGAAVGEKEKSSATSRWTRGTTTILEKIRADFNISSKQAPDRVAQIRLQKDTVPPHMLPTNTVTSPPITESPQEQDRAWNDVIVKFKTLILLSFDQRVSQYEEDIREKDSQRALPGWNFCTFFILKEGLARGFESVGLVEDALLGYDELSIGLDSIVRDQANEGKETQGGVFLRYTEDLYQQVTDIFVRSQKRDGARKQPQPHIHDQKPINTSKKNYRDLILSNNISVFDFRCYVFARQMSLLLRLGNSHSTRSDLNVKADTRPNASTLQRSVDDGNTGKTSTPRKDDSEDLFSLAELCSRALNFITFAGRLLREDILQGAQAQGKVYPNQLIDNLIRSWTFAAFQQVLDETVTSSLPFTKFLKDTSTVSSGKMLPFGNHAEEQKLSLAEPKTMIFPSRSSSLQIGRSSSADPPYAQPSSNGQVVFENGQYHDRPVPEQDGTAPKVRNDIQNLAATRAQLLVVQRRILQHVGQSLGWTIGLAAIVSTAPKKEDFSNVDLDEKDSDEEDNFITETPAVTSPTLGLSAASIVTAVSSLDQFRSFYETLSDLIVKHYMAAGQVKSGESILGDLAALRFELGDFNAAATYFGRMASLFAETRWNQVEAAMLRMHAQCLKKLNRKDEYVRTLLSLLAKSAAESKSIRALSGRNYTVSTPWLDDDKVDTTGVLTELVSYSDQLPYDIEVPMEKYFGDIAVEPFVRHFEDKDGFQLQLQFRHVLEDSVVLKKAKVRLSSATSTQGKDIWMESSGTLQLDRGLCRLGVDSNVSTNGPYTIDKIMIEVNRIVFVHEPSTKAEASTPLGITTSPSAASLKAAKKSRVLCFPRTEAFQAKLFLSHFIHIDKQRHIEFACSSGWNDIQHAQVRLKSATAGLRLRTADAAITDGDVEIKDKPAPGAFELGSMPSNSKANIQIPYDVELVLPELTIKMEIDYTTEKGVFQYHCAFTIPIELPLDVNVHDHFKNASLYSKFNIKTSSQIPLEVIDISLQDSDEFSVQTPRKGKDSTRVFPKQPMSMTYKIIRKSPDVQQGGQSLPLVGSLPLSVEYRCMDEDVIDRLRALFAASVQSSPVHRLGRLLISTFADRVEHRVLPHQYEKIALTDKVDMGGFEEMGWAECIDGLPQASRDDTRSWLQKWHETHRIISLSSPHDIESPLPIAPLSATPPRHIIITVSIPQTHILHTASLSIAAAERASPQSTMVAIVGQSLVTELSIKHTRRWGSLSSLVSAANLSSPDDPIEFVYTIEANPEIWLIAGQRRAHFTAKEGEECKVPIILVPMKVGNLLLPNIEIRPRIPPKDENKRQSSTTQSEEPLNCETDYLSYGECVMVVADVKGSTVGIGEMGSPKSTIWLETERRGGELG